MKKQIVALFLLLVLLLPMFAGIRRIKNLPKDRLEPESRWVVAMSDDAISVSDDKGKHLRLAKSELMSVAIETNDSGPWGADFWWLLYGPDGQLACTVPQGAIGEGELIEYLQGLPGFGNAEMTKAIRSTDNATFLVWKPLP